jgi:hypothetical protein
MLVLLAHVSLVATWLSPTEYGRFAVALAASQLLSLPVLSLQRPVLRIVSGISGDQQSVLATFRIIVTATSVVCAGVMVLISFAIFGIGLSSCLAVLAVLVGCVSGWIQVVQAAYRGCGSIYRGQVCHELIRPGMALLLCFILLWMRSEVAEIAMFGVFIASLASAVPLLGGSWSFRYASLRGRLAFATIVWSLIGTSATAMQGRIEIVVLGALGQVDAAGDLSILTRLAQLGAIGLSVANCRYAPAIARSLAGCDLDRVRSTAKMALFVGVSTGAVAATVLVLEPSSVLAMVGGATPSREVGARIMAFGLMVNVCTGLALTVVTMAGMERVAAIAQLGAVGVSVTLIMSLANRMDEAGALGYVVGLAISNICLAIVCSRRLDLSVSLGCLVRCGGARRYESIRRLRLLRSGG